MAELSAVELFSPDVDMTVWFFRDLLGMIETGRDGTSVFLRAWQDPYRHSLKITHRERPGMGAAFWRATSAAALARRVHAVQSSGLGQGWMQARVE